VVYFLVHRGFRGKPKLSAGASLAPRFQTGLKNVFITGITETSVRERLPEASFSKLNLPPGSDFARAK
jgi:hypothetical protein